MHMKKYVNTNLTIMDLNGGSDDKHFFRELIVKDSEVKSLEDLHNRHKEYYEKK